MNKRNSAFYGAAFLMATSAIGPGFLTQTASFTSKLFASFGFAIIISIIVDIIAQMNIWRIITVLNKRAQDIANEVVPGLGTFLSVLVITGGMIFNIGNIAGCGLGFSVLFNMDVMTGSMISAAIAIIIFIVKDAGRAMDWFAKILGFVMIGLTLYVAFVSHPPLVEALHKSFIPDTIDFKSIVTIVGGTVGGYITFSGAHRLLDAGINGSDKQRQVTNSAVTAIGIASLMRILLFLAALGIVMQGLTLNPNNPAASVFELAVGNIGLKLFGIVIWAAAVTSVVGASFTSVSFAQSFHPVVTSKKNYFIIGFIVVAALLFALFGNPVKVLIFAGAFNGFILAFSLGIMLIAIANKRIAKEYKHPPVLLIAGIVVALIMLVFGSMTIFKELKNLF